ncbi:MAG: cobalt transporter CbiM [Thermodesulfobacteriota bacterium]|nr:cobalt transporter CbiM [Thermodesulfobacteriota bacterium]
MHISEGILTAPVLAGGAVLTTIGTAVGLKKLDYDRIMTVSLFSAAFFVASLIHVPVGPGSVHLLLGGLLGLLLGWGAFPAIVVALSLQTIFFGYGGMIVLGVNGFTIAGPAVLCGLVLKPWLTGSNKQQMTSGFLAGFCSMLLSALLMTGALYLSDQNFLHAASLLLISHFPVMLIEGLITMFVVSFLARVQPEILSINN